MEIQKATLNELDSVVELFNSYRVFYKQKSNIDAGKEYLRERITNDESVIFIASNKTEAVGFIQLYPLFSSLTLERSWVLNDLFVKETARKNGVAESLMKKAIEFAKETNTKGILLETGEDNIPARSLYEKIGFKQEENLFYFYSV